MSRTGLIARALVRMLGNLAVEPFRNPAGTREYWGRVVGAAAQASWLPSGARGLPVVSLEEAVPETAGVGCDLRDYLPVEGNVVPIEMTYLARIARARRPRRIFEFGTFNGGSTLQLSANCPDDAEVFTLDLPADHPLRADASVVDISPVKVGERFLGTPWAERIRMLEGDSKTFDFAPYRNSMDLVFVDASHAEDYVESDSRAALDMLAPGGAVVWHDYAPHAPGVVVALGRLAADRPLRLLAQSSLVIYIDGAAALTPTP